MRKPILSFRITRGRLLIAVAICVFLALGLMIQGHPSNIPVVATMSGHLNSDLRERVELLAKQYDAEPINAKNDRVWKAIPGLNGLKIDVDATVKKSRNNPGETISLVAKQIPPKVSLRDLGPLPIYRGNPKKKQMALMINVAWGTEYIPDILALLKQNNVKATFFLDGSWTKKNPDVAKQIYDAGQEIGNHAYSHPDMSTYGTAAALREITRTNAVIQQATGITPKLFAPPGGAYNTNTLQSAYGQGMHSIMWTIDTLDWRKPPAATIANKVLTKAESGALVLMHPTEPTRDALRTLLPGLLQKGYSLVTVSELLDPTCPLPTT
ncbi:MAG: polysaccharide deacetylase family protein [Tumebacillaceae bacterium]